MAADEPRLHPHLFTPNAANSSPYTNPVRGGGDFHRTARNRAQHAVRLRRQIDQAQDEAKERTKQQKARGLDTGTGIVIRFESEPNFELKFESLDMAKSGVELLNVKSTNDGRTLASVLVPDKKLNLFLNRIGRCVCRKCRCACLL